MDEQKQKNKKLVLKEKKSVQEILGVKEENLPLISIIVLTYNQQYLLEDCLASILKQDYPKLELVICDDASPDFDAEETTRMVERLKKENLKNYIVFQQSENVGTTANAMKGIELSAGTIFKLHAGDDMLYSAHVVSNMVCRFLKDESVQIIAGRSVACTPDGKRTKDYYPSCRAIEKMQETNCVGQFRLMSTQTWGEYINAPAVFWRRELYNEIGGFDATYKYTEDWPTWLRITQKGIKIHSIKDMTTIYRYGGISNDFSAANRALGKDHYEECIRMLKEIAIPELEKNGDGKSLKKCRHCVEAIRARITSEFEWNDMTLAEKLSWRLSHFCFLMQSRFYRKGASGFQIPLDNFLALLSLLVILVFYFVQQKPEAILAVEIVCLAYMLYFGIVRKQFGFGKCKLEFRNKIVMALCFLFYIVQAGVLPIQNIARFWAGIFTVAAGGYFTVVLVAIITKLYFRQKEKREL